MIIILLQREFMRSSFRDKASILSLPVIDELENYLLSAIQNKTPTPVVADWVYRHSMIYRDYYVDLDFLNDIRNFILRNWKEGLPYIDSRRSKEVRGILFHLRDMLGYARQYPRVPNTETPLDAIGEQLRNIALLSPQKAIPWKELPGDFARGWMRISESHTKYSFPLDNIGRALAGHLFIAGKYEAFAYSEMTEFMKQEDIALTLEFDWVYQRCLENLARDTTIELNIPQLSISSSSYLHDALFAYPTQFAAWVLRLRAYGDDYDHHLVGSGLRAFLRHLSVFIASSMVRRNTELHITMGGPHVPAQRAEYPMISHMPTKSGTCSVDIIAVLNSYVAVTDSTARADFPTALDAFSKLNGQWFLDRDMAYAERNISLSKPQRKGLPE